MSSAGYNTCVLLSGHSLGRFLSSLAEGAVERSQSLGAFAHVQVLVRAYAGRDASKWLAIADPELLGCWQDPGGIRPPICAYNWMLMGQLVNSHAELRVPVISQALEMDKDGTWSSKIIFPHLNLGKILDHSTACFEIRSKTCILYVIDVNIRRKHLPYIRCVFHGFGWENWNSAQ